MTVPMTVWVTIRMTVTVTAHDKREDDINLSAVSEAKADAVAVPINLARLGRNCGASTGPPDLVLDAIARCGHGGHTVLEGGVYNITRKMTWDLVDAKVDLHGYLSFTADIQYWLNATNMYRVVFIQSQASWFVITGRDFEVNAHGTGGIQGNGQAWWKMNHVHYKRAHTVSCKES
ncbi:hypothetical protein B0H10DRAFT_1957315 [Mycena sp. CBHHK59/15]|nr:hypothetical protein B0H10DRAFT_1957315 [Mycena sp. CBHHK59/15]